MKKLFLLLLVTYTGLCSAQTSQAIFEKQIFELLKHSDNNFKEIKGEVIQGTTDEFTTTYKMNGSAKNVIWEVAWTSFIATYPVTKDSSEAYTTFKKMEESIRKVLGDKTTSKTFEEEKQVTANTLVNYKMIKFLKEENDLTFYFVDLELQKSRRKMNSIGTLTIEWTIRITIYQGL